MVKLCVLVVARLCFLAISPTVSHSPVWHVLRHVPMHVPNCTYHLSTV
jgi:hypothetical protein